MNKTDVQPVKTAGLIPLTQGARSVQGMLQRKCACGNHTVAGGECMACGRKKQTLQRRTSGRNPVVETEAPPIIHAVLRSSGQPLDSQTQALMTRKFGQDFSRVRVHTDTQAAESARQVSALAYTVGQDIVFGSGRYSPHTREGKQLVAHELAHTIQQDGRGGSMAGALRIGNPDDRYEQEADRVADQVLMAPAQSASDGVHSVATLPPRAEPLQVARLVASAEEAPEPLIPLESGATPMASGPECSRQRNRGQSLPLARTAFRGERGFAYIPSDGHPGPGGLLVTGNSVAIKISARWEEQIPDPDQRPPDQRSRRADRPQYYLSFSGWVDDCDSTNAGGPASSIRTANLAIGTEHTVNLASLIPGRYGLQVNPSTASAEPNRVLAGTCEVT